MAFDQVFHARAQIMPTRNISRLLLDLPVTLKDYMTFYRNKDFDKIQSISKRLLDFESQLVSIESANHIVVNGCAYLSAIISSYKKAPALALKSFADVSEHFGGKLIFFGFILEANKYIEGAIIPINEGGVIIIYLPVSTNPPKVLCSSDLMSRKAINFLVNFMEMWKDTVINYIRIRVN